MLEINVAQLIRSPIGSARNYKVGELADIAGDGTGIMVQGEVRLTRTNRGILVNGIIDTEVELTCSRCLSLFRSPQTLRIEEEYFPVGDVATGAPLSVPDEPGCFSIDEHHVIDLTEAIRQYVLLAIPMKPLCREDCAGICPRCGQNLNQQVCTCPSQEEDPRWSRLKELILAGLAEKQEGAE